jgi:hypothetical protein
MNSLVGRDSHRATLNEMDVSAAVALFAVDGQSERLLSQLLEASHHALPSAMGSARAHNYHGGASDDRRCVGGARAEARLLDLDPSKESARRPRAEFGRPHGKRPL